MEVHDVRLISLEKDIIDDMIHFKKRLDGIEYRIDKVVPPPVLLPNTLNEHRPLTYAAVVSQNKEKAKHEFPTQQPPENKSIIIEGLTEYPLENLEEIVFELLREIGIRMTDCDYNKVERLGRWNQARQWPRPIKLELVTTHKKNKILATRDLLKETNDYYNVRIQADEPKRVRVGKAMIRQAAARARQEGKMVHQTQDSVVIDGTKYDIDSIQTLENGKDRRDRKNTRAPTVVKTGRPPHKEKPYGASEGQSDTHLKYAENLCTLDTPYGLAFFTIRNRLSNFYPCEISVNGRLYQSVEHGYQAEKALCANDQARFHAILKAETPSLAKKIGSDVAVNVKWIHVKREVMRKLLYAKFTQHPELGEYLCSTKGRNLIEGSTDDYWGAGVPLHSKEMIEGDWLGRNELGRLLVSIRDELLQERDVKRVTTTESEKMEQTDVNLINLEDKEMVDDLTAAENKAGTPGTVNLSATAKEISISHQGEQGKPEIISYEKVPPPCRGWPCLGSTTHTYSA